MVTKKPRTPKQLAHDKKLGELRKAKKKVELPGEDFTKTPEEVNLPKAESPQVESQSPTDMLLMRLMAEIDELKKQKNPNFTPEAALEVTAQMTGQPTLGKNGLQGKVFKYPVEESYYANPLQRLYKIPELRRFNLSENYFLDWVVEGVEYEKYNITYAEPRFTIRLFRKMFADDGVTETGQMALINRNILHEDEIVARIALEKLNLTDDFPDFREAMNEVRFLRVKRWLLELFSIPKVEQHSRQPKQMVVDGKVVEMYDTETLIDSDSGISKAHTLGR